MLYLPHKSGERGISRSCGTLVCGASRKLHVCGIVLFACLLVVIAYPALSLGAHGCTPSTCAPWFEGGTVTQVGDYRVHVFTSSGTLTMVSGGTVEYLVVGGGGAGGRSAADLSKSGGGGGGGGVKMGTIALNSSQSITVGRGGRTSGENGTASRIGSLVAVSGGGGGGHGADSAWYTGGRDGRDGASGGGGAAAHYPTAGGSGGDGIPGEGNRGGRAYASSITSGGGGGGASRSGANGSSSSGGAGGDGIQSDISGSARWYGGGGGGGGGGGSSDTGAAVRGGAGGKGGGGKGGSDSSGSPGAPNTGGGGGGGGGNWSGAHNGGAGGSGIVIVRYIPRYVAPTCTLAVSPSSYNATSSATLSWTTQNASSFTITADPSTWDVGPIPPSRMASSSTTVSPSETVTYTGRVYGSDGRNSTCQATLTVRRTCALPWGGTIRHGQSVTAYRSDTVPYGQSCSSQRRTCSDGTLSGTYGYASCAVEDPRSCTLDGLTLEDGESHTFYTRETAPSGETCSSVSQVRTCRNGTLSGSDSYDESSCSCTPRYSCSGDVIEYTDASCETREVAQCVSPAFCSEGAAQCLSEPPRFNASDGLTGHLQARPSLVRRGETSRIHWNLSYVEQCTVTGSNGDSWTGFSSAPGGMRTSPITRQTTYTLACDGLDGSTVREILRVDIAPLFREL